MMNMVFSICGKIGSGKSYLANKIAEHYKGIILSMDKIMLKLFGEIDGRELFENKHRLCLEMIYETSENILENSNGNIIFDKYTFDLLNNMFEEFYDDEEYIIFETMEKLIIDIKNKY